MQRRPRARRSEEARSQSDVYDFLRNCGGNGLPTLPQAFEIAMNGFADVAQSLVSAGAL